MNPYPPIATWVIPASALEASLEGVRSAGTLGVESGALWLGVRDTVAVVNTVVLPHGPGVIESPGYWQLTPEVMAAITGWARPRALVMLGMFHIHVGDSVALSWSDRNRVVQVPDILSVIAGGAGRQTSPTKWGWYVYVANDYRSMSKPERAERIVIDPRRSCATWRASSLGVEKLSV